MDIYAWCKENEVDVFVTKDRQFALIIGSGESHLKCILCTFGNRSLADTVQISAESKAKIEYFAKSHAKILHI